jgi:hypothetical protein
VAAVPRKGAGGGRGAILADLQALVRCALDMEQRLKDAVPHLWASPTVVAWAFVMSFFTLMCGLILEGFKDVVTTELEKSEWPGRQGGLRATAQRGTGREDGRDVLQWGPGVHPFTSPKYTGREHNATPLQTRRYHLDVPPCYAHPSLPS